LILLAHTALASPAVGGIVVSSYYTLSQTNGYAPTSQTTYWTEDRKSDVSPAGTSVSADWTGTNAGGGPATRRFVTSAQATSTTALDNDTLSITANGAFQFELTTTAGFVDPGSSQVSRPGAIAQYRGFFSSLN
jgi:hypothetical protein